MRQRAAEEFLLFSGKTIGQSLLQMTFAVFIGFLGFTTVMPW